MAGVIQHIRKSTVSSHTTRHEERLRHDLRQSLATIRALVAVIERDPLLAGDALDRLSKVREEAGWMFELLASSDTEAGQTAVVDVGETVSEAWTSASADAACSMRLVREADAHAFLDAVALRRSVRNLIDNAVRAAGPCGSVEVSVRPYGMQIVVEVSDSGPGFGKVPAQQGLGLLTVRQFVTASGGSLSVGRSTLGGAQLTLVLPGAALQERDPA